VSKLQKDFFAGDIDKAYEQALTLGFDNEQINSMSLEIIHTHTSKMTQAYNNVGRSEEKSDQQLDRILKPVLDFMEHFIQLMKTRIKFLVKGTMQVQRN